MFRDIHSSDFMGTTVVLSTSEYSRLQQNWRDTPSARLRPNLRFGLSGDRERLGKIWNSSAERGNAFLHPLVRIRDVSGIRELPSEICV